MSTHKDRADCATEQEQDLLDTCIHEAGHAVFALMLRARFRRVRINRTRRSYVVNSGD
jgi:hypothetical protein